MTQKIVVTGMGIVSALGSTVDTAAQALAAGRSGVNKIGRFGAERFYGAVQEFNVADYIRPNEARRMDPISTFTIAVGRQALNHANLSPALSRECGLLVGTGFSGLRSVVEHQKKFLRDGIKKLSPFHFPNTVYNASAGLAAIELGVAGPNSTVVGVDVSGEQAVLYGVMMLHQGVAERVLVIGVDEISQSLAAGFEELGLLNASDTAAYPFARYHRGFDLGEGGAALLLETENAACARSATALATIEGIGVCASAQDPYSHDVKPDFGLMSVRQSLRRAELELSDIDWVSSPANGSKTLDAGETNLWTSALPGNTIKVTALKGYTGEFASSGVLRLALGIACSRNGIIPAMSGAQNYDAAMVPWLQYETHPQPTSEASLRFLHHGAGVGGSHISLIVNCATHGISIDVT